MIPVLCFPATKGSGLNKLNMNYSCLIYGGTMSLALLWYAVDAKKYACTNFPYKKLLSSYVRTVLAAICYPV